MRRRVVFFLGLCLALFCLLGFRVSGQAVFGGSISVGSVDQAGVADPYDLSPYEAEIVAVFDDNSEPRPAWPTAPAITSGPTVVSDCSALSSSLAVSGRHTRVETGVTIGSPGSPCGAISIASDSWLEMQGTATLYANLTGGDSNRIRISGGTVHLTDSYTMDGDDLLVENGNWSQTSDTTAFQNSANVDSGVGSRRAFVQNTITGGSYAIFLAPRPGPLWNFDTIIVGNELDGGTTRDESTVRLMNLDRLIYAANWGTNSTGAKAVLRLYDYSSNAIITDNVHLNDTGFMYEAASTPTHPGDMDNLRFSDNRGFKDGAYAANTVAVYNSAGGGFSCSNVTIVGNQLITTPNSAYSDLNCGGATGGGTNADLDDPPYNGVIPTCATLGCGAGN